MDKPKGLFSHAELIDTLMQDCEKIMKSLVSGKYLDFAMILIQMLQKLTNLKGGIEDDLQSMKNKIDELKKVNDEMNEKLNYYIQKEGGKVGEN